MDCPKCGAEMYNKATLSAAVGGVLTVANLNKKLLDGDKQSNVICYGCPECGYMEMYAQNPKVFKDK